MRYTTADELDHFDFRGAFVGEMMQMKGYFKAELDNVIIRAGNSCNRDIRDMRANNLTFTIQDGQIVEFIEEGYKVYDANGRLMKQYEDTPVAKEMYNELLESFAGAYLYEIRKEDCYSIFVDTQERTYHLLITGTADKEEWDRFLNLEAN